MDLSKSKLLRLCATGIGTLPLSAAIGVGLGWVVWLSMMFVFIVSGLIIGVELDYRNIDFENHQIWFLGIGAFIGILINLIWFYLEYSENQNSN